MKKNLLATVIFMLAVAALSAQAPQFINYQAVARNAQGNVLPNQTVTVRLTIYSGTPTGAIAHLETDTVTTNQFGLFTIAIGKSSPIPGGFAGIAWSSGNKYLKVELDPAAGTNFSDMGTSQLLSVPYALSAKTSEDNSWLKNGNDIYNANTGKVGIGTSAPATSAALDITSTTGALLLPRMTKTQRDALTAVPGMVIYNTDSNKFQGCALGQALDQSFTTINNGGGEDRAQSFTAGLNGALTKIELPLSTSESSFDLNVAILDGEGLGGTVLSNQQLTIYNAGGFTWYPVNITGVNVTAGNKYTIHITEVATCGFPICYSWGMDTNGNNYAGGQFYYAGTPYNGGTIDCAFKTYVQQAGWVDLH